MSASVPPTKRGRPATPVFDENRHQVIGLSPKFIKNKAGEVVRTQYYATGTRPPKYFGSELKEAIAAFRRWQSQQKNERVVIEEATPCQLNGTIFRTRKSTM